MSAEIQAYPSPYHARFAPLPSPSCVTASSYHHLLQYTSPAIDNLPDTTQSVSVLTNAYMNPILPQPAVQQCFYSSPHRGIKRSAPDPEDELDRSNVISSQFKKLRINNNNPTLQHDTTSQIPHHNTDLTPTHSHNHVPTDPTQQSSLHSPSPTQQQPMSNTIPTLPSDDFMTIDETPHKIYISDLDSEIASIEAVERLSNQLFLPDFEKQIGAIPDHVLRSSVSPHQGNPSQGAEANQQALVLYQDPSSISVPEEQDVVRMAILETRRGIRERMRRDQKRERETAHFDYADGQSPSSPPRSVSRSTPGDAVEQTAMPTQGYNWGYAGDDAMDIE